jgi:hypothetical protein
MGFGQSNMDVNFHSMAGGVVDVLAKSHKGSIGRDITVQACGTQAQWQALRGAILQNAPPAVVDPLGVAYWGRYEWETITWDTDSRAAYYAVVQYMAG